MQVVYYSCQLCLVFLPDEVIHLAVMVKTHQNAGDRSSTSRPTVLDAKYQQNFSFRSSGFGYAQKAKLQES